MPILGAPPQQAIHEVFNMASPVLKPPVCKLREQVLLKQTGATRCDAAQHLA
jgi:hypothetical protein